MKKLIISLLVLLPFLAYSQDEVVETAPVSPCVQNIETAQQRYDQGRIQDIQNLLQDCLNRGEYNKAQKSQALRLLTLAYIFLEDEEKAEETMLHLLQTNHEFKVDPTIDPTEFINLHEQFRYKPLFSVGLRYIANLSQPIISGINNSLNLTNNRPDYPLGEQISPISFGLNFEYEFAPNFVLYPEIHYRLMRVVTYSTQEFITNPDNLTTVVNHERQTWLAIPVSVKYNLNFSGAPDLKVYFNLGGSFDYLLKASKPADKNLLLQEGTTDVGFPITNTEDKNRINYGVIAGAGLTYKLGEGFISLEGRYHYSLSQLTSADHVLNPTNAAQYNTGAQDDIFRLNHIAVSLGYTLNIYIPKQLR